VLDHTGIAALAYAIPDMRAMTSLNLADNDLGELALPITRPAGWEEGNNKGDGRRIFRKPGGKWGFGVPLGIITLADAIKDMGALNKLDISNNRIGAEQEGDLQRISVASGIELTQ
jgi:hypothetical protein